MSQKDQCCQIGNFSNDRSASGFAESFAKFALIGDRDAEHQNRRFEVYPAKRNAQFLEVLRSAIYSEMAKSAQDWMHHTKHPLS